MHVSAVGDRGPEAVGDGPRGNEHPSCDQGIQRSSLKKGRWTAEEHRQSQSCAPVLAAQNAGS